jgi:hypothetical protein
VPLFSNVVWTQRLLRLGLTVSIATLLYLLLSKEMVPKIDIDWTNINLTETTGSLG